MVRRQQNGETLVEVLIAIVLIGLVVGSYLATYSTAAMGSKQHRDAVTADQLLRTYAENAKQAASTDCVSSSTFTTTTTSIPGFNVAATSTLTPVNKCPSTTASPTINQLTFSVTTPENAPPQQLVVNVRTP